MISSMQKPWRGVREGTKNRESRKGNSAVSVSDPLDNISPIFSGGLSWLKVDGWNILDLKWIIIIADVGALLHIWGP